MKIKKTDFAKLLSPHTRDWLDAKDWLKLLSIIRDVLGEQLMQGNSIQTHFGEFYRIENLHKTIFLNGKEIPIKNKYQARCSCANQFKGIVNAGKK